MIAEIAAVAAAMLPAPASADAGPLKLPTSDACHTQACKARTCRTWECKQRILPWHVKAMLRRLRGCETRGIPYPANYRYTGAHDGAYQYSPSTWHRAGGRQARASYASPAEQDVRTARFYPTHRGEWQCVA